MGSTEIRTLQHNTTCLRRLPVHFVRSGIFQLPRCPNGQRNLRQTTTETARIIHGISLGLQRKNLLLERRRPNLRDQAGTRFRNPCDQRSPRTLSCNALHRRQQIVDSDSLQVVLPIPSGNAIRKMRGAAAPCSTDRNIPPQCEKGMRFPRSILFQHKDNLLKPKSLAARLQNAS